VNRRKLAKMLREMGYSPRAVDNIVEFYTFKPKKFKNKG